MVNWYVIRTYPDKSRVFRRHDAPEHLAFCPPFADPAFPDEITVFARGDRAAQYLKEADRRHTAFVP